MDNGDGTLSIFGTVLDHAGPVGAPAPGDASGFDTAQLASLARVIGWNDPQAYEPSGGRGRAGRSGRRTCRR
jgi:ABC-type amino acid transport substrate-binding protein